MRVPGKIRLSSIRPEIVLLIIAAIVLGVILYTGPVTREPHKEAVGGVEISSDALFTYEVTRYEAQAVVTKPVAVENTISIGVATDRDSLKFGEIPAGSNYAMRELSLVNLEDTPAKVSMFAEGNIAPHIRFKDNGFVMPGRSNATVRVFFLAEGANMGEYEGGVLIQIKRPRFPALGMLE